MTITALASLALLACLFPAHEAPEPTPVWCRYTVRDVGFVQTEPAEFDLQLIANDSLRARAEEQFRADLLHGNLSFESISGTPQAPRIALLDSLGRTKEWGPFESDGAFLQGVDSVLRSALRDEIARETVGRFSVVLLLESGDEEADQRAERAVHASIEWATQAIPGMAKSVGAPPRLRSVDPEEQLREPVVVFGLGLELPQQEPAVAVLYGRCRRIGPVLVGPAISTGALRDLFALLGSDCECDLDRDLLRGRALPFVASREYRDRAASALGFDPEDPRVRSEVIAILAGNGAGGGRGTASVLHDDDLLAGYVERNLDPIAERIGSVPTLLAPGPNSSADRDGSKPPEEPSNLADSEIPESVREALRLAEEVLAAQHYPDSAPVSWSLLRMVIAGVVGVPLVLSLALWLASRRRE